jgi:DNA-binding CsgD family transcriptional regulator
MRSSPLRHIGADGLETNSKTPPAKSAAGFLLLDSSLRPISFNAEAIQVLGYPDSSTSVRRPDVFLAGKIRSSLMSPQSSRGSRLVDEFRSGRRRYFCRAFLVDSNAKDPSHPSIAVLLERGPSGLVPVLQIAQQFNLTRREGDALEYLLQGLSGKEIATRMSVSPNTVKAFMRLIMIKMGVSSRSAVVARALMTAS